MLQYPLFSPPTKWTAPLLGELPSWKGAKRIGLDIESRDPELRRLGPGLGRRPNSYTVGVSFAIEDGPAYYLPARHLGGGNLPEDAVFRYLREQASEFDGEIVGANLPYEIDGLASEGVHFRQVKRFRDVMIADPLICELHNSYSLEAIAQRWNLEGKNETLLREAAKSFGLDDPKTSLWKLPAGLVGPYAEQDARLPLLLLRKQERQIEEQDLWRVYDLESDVLPIVTDMRIRGVRVDLDRLARIEAWALDEETTALAEFRRLTGTSLTAGDLNKAEAKAQALAKLGYHVPRTRTGKPHVDQTVLAKIDHAAIPFLARALKVSRLLVFASSVHDHLATDGRIHCTYNQLRKQKDEEGAEGDTEGAAYGRLSCVHPNLQNQPARDDFAPMWRAIYLPENGESWAALDYSQQEPRMAVHYACLAGPPLIGQDAWERALLVRDKYRSDPSTDNHQMMADLAGIRRKAAKEIYLGLSYGMGGAKMCRKLGLPTRFVVRGPRGRLLDVASDEGRRLLADGGKRFEAAGVEGQAIIDRFNQAVPFVLRLARACEKRAREVGYITTLSGRRCHFPTDAAGNFDWTHKALNRLIQGASADQMKMAMVALHRAGVRMLVQVHDEVGISCANAYEAKQATTVMLDCCPLEVPSKVDIEMGDSWGGSMGYTGN